jgi:hypothetical protein
VFRDEELTVFLVAHTHWDREWYAPFETLRAALVELLDDLLERLEKDPDYPDFVLDGQTVLLEDYLEVRPEAAPRLAALAERGRLRLGPWYVLPDEFLVSGEALVRNLERGLKMSRQRGSHPTVGYVPDCFGHVSQLPRLLAGFGLTSCLFTRGLGAGPISTAYRWQGLLALQQVRSYSHVGRLHPDPEQAARRLRQAVDELKPYLPLPVVLLCHGGDHRRPHPRLPEVLAALRRQGAYAEVRSGGYEDYAAAVARLGGVLPELSGELRGGRLFPLLTGVLSARVPLKLANHRVQLLLERRAEPLDALAALAGARDSTADLRQRLLELGWRELLRNHPHDSLAGCCADAVHRENLVRFEKAGQLALEVVERAEGALFWQVDTRAPEPALRALLVWNPSARPRREVVRCRLLLAPGEAPGRLALFTREGQPVPLQLLSRSAGEGHHPYDSDLPVEVAELAFLPPEIPPLGWDVLHLRVGRHPPEAAVPRPARAEARGLGNGWLALQAGPQGLEVEADGLLYRGLNRLEDGADAGDSYTFCPGGPARSLPLEGCRVLHPGPLLATLALTAPELEVRLSVAAGSRRLDLAVHLEHRRQDHRLQAVFPLGERPTNHFAHTPFDVVERSVEAPDPCLWRWETPPAEHPCSWMCGLAGPRRRLALFPRGLAEYSLRGDELGLTLVRAVGWLSRQGLATRRVEAGPKLAVPEAQCPGALTLEYALRLGPGPLMAEAEDYQLPLQVVELPLAEGPLPPRQAWLEIEGPALLSGLRRRPGGLEVRVYHPGPGPCPFGLRTWLPVGKPLHTDLAGRVQGEPPDHLQPGQILTLLLPC